MKYRSLVYSGLLVMGLIFLAQAVWADSSSRYARIRHVEGDVILYPSDGQRPSDATINSPVLDRDEIETQNGRVEISFSNGIVVRMGDYSAIRIESIYSPMTLTLLQGTVFVDSHLVDRFGDELEVRAGDAQIFLINEGNLRVDLGNEGGIRVTTLDGEAEVRAAGNRVLLGKDERTYIEAGYPPERPESFARNYDELDDWNQDRIEVYASAGNSRGYVQDSIYYDTYDLDNYGDWRAYGDYGHVWVPRVHAGWRPYYDGRWSYSNSNWFWVSYEPWGWGPYHYGRWDWSPHFGWYWIPGYTFGPSWVSWYNYGDYVGWCPLNYYNYPVYYNRPGYYYPGVQKQKTIGVSESWTFVRKAALGESNIKRISVSGSEIKGIQIDKSQVTRQPEKSLVSYVAGKGTKAIPNSYTRKSQAVSSQTPGQSVYTGSPAKRTWETRDYGNRRTGSSSTSVKPGTTTPQKQSTTKGYSGSSSGSSSGKKATSSSSSSSSSKKAGSSGSSGSSDKKASPPNFSRDEQYERYLPSRSGYSSRLSGETASPISRDRQFGTWSYSERQSPGDEATPWFRDYRNYDEPDRAYRGEVSPRYLEGAKKVFEGFESSRNSGSSREAVKSSGSYGSSGSKHVDTRSTSSSGKSYSGKSSGSSRSSGGAVKAAPKASSSSSKKPN